MFRKTKDGRIYEWKVEKDDHLCTLQDAFRSVEHSSGFNIELKFDDNLAYKEDELAHALQAVLQVLAALYKIHTQKHIMSLTVLSFEYCFSG